MTARRDRGVVAIVGRPNVGKSTLFNRIAGRRIAIEEPTPGITRDRIYVDCEWLGKRFVLIDTGGLQLTEDRLHEEIVKQVQFAIEEADVIVFVTDGKEGPAGFDQDIAEMLRRTGKPVVVAVNKIDSLKREDNIADFYVLAVGEVIGVSAAHGLSVDDLLDSAVSFLPETAEPTEEEEEAVRVAIVGRPNVGKSSLLNAIIGQERMVVDEAAGTTRDSIDTPYQWKDRGLVLIDTAGIRRKSRVKEDFEYYSVLRAFGAIDRSDVALTLIDAGAGLTDQDKRIAGRADAEGRAQVLVVSKWDLRAPEGTPEATDRTLMTDMSREVHAWLPEIRYAPVVFVSAHQRRGLEALLDTVLEVADHHSFRFQTSELNRLIEEATYRRPLSRRGRELRIYYAAQVTTRPPTIALFVNDPELVHFSHLAYLQNQIRARAPLEGTPIRFSVRASHDRDRARSRKQ
jgi:GTP-binding protein